MEQMQELQSKLPHLYLHKFYKWQREFFDSTNTMNFICASNQSGKSTNNLIKSIKWSIETDLWPKLWRDGGPPTFWYLYPGKETLMMEFEDKWRKYLPKNGYEDHPVYGWEIKYLQRAPFCLTFNTGAKIYFRTYGQDLGVIQASTLHAVFTDEELFPHAIYDELAARMFATDGYFHMVFTATRGQEVWRRTMEEKGDKELFPDAAKWNVSMYDCMEYEDGSPGMFTDKKINAIKNKCKSEAEIQRRVYGRFVLEDDRKYESFSPKRNVVVPKPVPSKWDIYAGVDLGSGGKNHPSAISLVAVRPDYKYAVLFDCWRGDGQITTARDVLEKYIEMTRSVDVMLAYYDWHAKDFKKIADSAGVPFLPAEKSHDIGESLLNVLFKNQMLDIYDTHESQKLVSELVGLRNSTPKNRALDDLTDSLRYACSSVRFDFSDIDDKKVIKIAKQTGPTEDEIRRGIVHTEEFDNSIDSEIEEWNDYYEV